MKNKLDNAGILIERGNNKYSNDDVKGAIVDYSAAIEADPEFYLSFLKRAQAKCTTSDIGLMLEAYADFSRAIELNPNSAEAYEGRGALRMSLSPDDPSCQDDFDKALKLKSDNFMSYWNIGISKLKSEDYEEMHSAFTQLLKYPIDEKYKGDAFYFKALANMRLENYSTAIVDFTEALKNRAIQNFIWTYLNRAICHQSINNLNEALNDINSFLELKPNHIDGLEISAQLKTSLDDNKGAIEDYDRIIDLDKQNINALSKRGMLNVFAGNYDDALRDYKELIKTEPTNSDYQCNIGTCLFGLQRYSEAINYYDIAINLNANLSGAFHYRGLCYLHLENDQACIDLRTAYNLGYESSKEYMDKYCDY